MIRISEPMERVIHHIMKAKYAIMKFYLKRVAEIFYKKDETRYSIKVPLTEKINQCIKKDETRYSIKVPLLINIINQIFVFSAAELSLERNKHTRSIKGKFYNTRKG
jgi:hypothetical protein